MPPHGFPSPVSTLHVKMLVLPIQFDMPRHDKMFLLRAGAACTVEGGAGRRVEGKGKEIQGINEVGHERASDAEVEETADIYNKCQAEDDIEDSLPWLGATRCVGLGSERGVEGLVLGIDKCIDCGGVIPVVNKRRVYSG